MMNKAFYKIRWRIVVFVIFILNSTFYSKIHAQDSFNGFSISPKVIVVSGTHFATFGIGISGNYYHNRNIITLEEALAGSLRAGISFTADFNNQFNLLFGRYSDFNIFRLKYQIGVGYLHLNTYDTNTVLTEDPPFVNINDEYNTYNTVGYILKLGGELMLSRYFSIGLDLNANFNKYKFLFSPMLKFDVGIMKPSKRKSLNY